MLFGKYATAVIFLTVWGFKMHSGTPTQLLNKAAWNFHDINSLLQSYAEKIDF